ncbi:uncharacterized protein N7518_001719 [Penicillium psychrosexuale]|uniref:uncharacterized protein n=1 Tax=Penicillium psychrosexuale TaxID=1002107 RepID=UPI002545624B|nr:uncharacterized protein N7518_001719 [Penicillium psychrosexuale]KAJ5799651.1 hypothetical protein N7518_001719 [Penicillium psychrosexuale]
MGIPRTIINQRRPRHSVTCPSLAETTPKLGDSTPRSDLDRLFGLVEDVGEVALTTVLAVVHSGHEDTGTTL